MSGEQRTNINPHCKKMKIPFVYRMPLMKLGFFFGMPKCFAIHT